MKHGSLFSGIGGFDLAAEWMGWENVFHCEWMEFPRKVLDYYWPDADSHVDICKTDFKKYEGTIDIISGGFPCQPFSLAGKRKGTDDERYLWHEMLRAIREIKPKWVIAENVFGITNIDGGMVFEQVCLDLEAEGYEVQPFIIPACAKNAPHQRLRCWFVAYCNHNGLHGTKDRQSMGKGNDNNKTGQNKTKQFEGCSNKNAKLATNTNSNGLNERNCNDEINASERRINAQCDFEQSISNGNATDTMCKRQPGKKHCNTQSGQHCQNSQRNDWHNFPTQSPICSGDDGLPTQLDGITFSKWRNESIKGYGNAIVPQIALQLFQIIEHESKNQNT